MMMSVKDIVDTQGIRIRRTKILNAHKKIKRMSRIRIVCVPRIVTGMGILDTIFVVYEAIR